TFTAVLLGASFGLALVGFGRAVFGVAIDPDAPPKQPVRQSLGQRFDRFGLRLGLASVSAVALGVLTWWPVGIVLAAVGGSAVAVVTGVTVVFSVGIVVLNPTYVDAYRSPIGQLVLCVVAAFFGGAYWWLARASRPSTTGRFLHAGSSASAPVEVVR